ncbi:hypothetical protein SASPL_137046 [Salvia splendens]|uniref:Uncharacterized protein n=1 Tax=Salvia splendens TaxID=180675 RepID=A0A8X8WSR2_SALSN|nr:uncharacterized oxidoreductase At4g09670-like [Salvia splendens]KAG6400221.1 hypothetical protein SASPL_137046 [Salvia splendens]
MSVLGVNGFFRLHDFIIPIHKNVGPFNVTSNTKFTHLSLGIEPEPTEQVARADLPQEALMVKEFASLVTKIRDHGSESEKKWSTISRKTQLIVDAVKASIDKGYVAVEIVE